MRDDIQTGDRVKLVAIPDWLIHDLPDEEKSEILSFTGKTTTVTQIDRYGYLWVDFSMATEDEHNAYCTGHSFCVTRECLEKCRDESQQGAGVDFSARLV